ncbi:MAG TPA: hypothetical protein ENH12_03425 [Proteobacteria bacterium]|nr:hypothetical protein [Pseudomonadota bacterium]
MERNKKILSGLLVLLLVIIAFEYGFLSRQYKLFPYRYFKNLSPPVKEKKAGLRPVLRPMRKGRWHLSRDGIKNTELSDKDQKQLSKLKAVPYLSGYHAAPPRSGVTEYEKQYAYPGLNLCISGHTPGAYLMDMEGNILHRWGIEYKEVWPESDDLYENGYRTFWQRVHLFNNGDILAIFEGLGLVKLDRDSHLLWSYKGRCHHDLYVDKTGKIYVLTRREIAQRDELHLQGPILDDRITILSPQGKEIESISLIDCFLNSDYASVLDKMKRKGDVLHTNTVEIIEGDLSNNNHVFKQGQALVSIREINTIAVVDLEKQKISWALSGMWKGQHNPTLLKNGNILIFDNRGYQGKSKVIEFDPLTQKIIWSYRSTPENNFFSSTVGVSQRLPNGNTLITETDNGRAFEVMPDNKIVWEYINPYRAGEQKELIATLLDMIRISPNQISFLPKSAPSPDPD